MNLGKALQYRNLSSFHRAESRGARDPELRAVHSNLAFQYERLAELQQAIEASEEYARTG